MTTAELKEYLAMVIRVEKEINMQEQLCQRMKQKEVGYNQSIEYFERKIEEYDAYQERPICPQYTLTQRTGILGLLDDFLGVNEQKKKTEQYRYERAMEEYEKKNAKYDAAQKERRRCYEQILEMRSEIAVFERSYEEINRALQRSRYNLEKLYSYNIIYPKYRNYIMVSSLYEYLEAGRCVKLEGHEGAYNILELEIRLDRIITQLDRILQNLAAIQANQYTLYTCLQESNQKLNMLLQEESRMADSLQGLGSQTATMNARLADMQKSSELTNYLAECNQRELHYMNRMNYLAGHYDNPYGNYTPV